jgi:hypothetical protein
MPLANAQITDGATTLSLTITGGSAISFTDLGSPSVGKKTLMVASDTDERTRRYLDVTVKSPTIDATKPNGFTQSRKTVRLRKPKTLANGKVAVNTIEITVATDVETTQTDYQNLIQDGAQLIMDADFLNLWKLGAIA